MPDKVLTQLDLNRTTLARQMLLERHSLSVPAAVERLVGLQAQMPSAPFVGLWTRMKSFSRTDLAGQLMDRSIVKATTIRGTLHLVTAGDFLKFRACLQPMLSAGWGDIAGRKGVAFDLDQILEAGKAYIAEQPRKFADISERLLELFPEYDVGAMRYGVRTHLPLVQVPVSTGWSYPGNPEFTLAESWLGKAVTEGEDLPALLLRYLEAFGPASVTDMQTWSGMPKLKDTVEKMKPNLQVYKDENRRELFDVPGLELTPPDVPAPIRFLPEYDNLLLSHSNRTRVVSNDYRPKVYLPGLRVSATFLVDGFVKGVWRMEKKKGAAVLTLEPFEPVTSKHKNELVEEGERLIRFVEEDAKSWEVRFEETA